MNQREQARLQVLNRVMEYQLPRAQAAEILGISERQLRRVLAAYRRDGAAALVHGNRGRQPSNAIPEDVAAAAVMLAREKYAGFNHSHLTEVLAEREGIHLSRQAVSRLLNGAGLPSARRRRPPQHRVRRERMPQEGMLLQIDGSHHPWLEGRGPRFVLLLAVDDATGALAYCRGSGVGALKLAPRAYQCCVSGSRVGAHPLTWMPNWAAPGSDGKMAASRQGPDVSR